MLDIAWAAGIIEGEGTLTLESCGTSPRVSVCQKEPFIIERLQALFGGSMTLRPGRISNPLSQSDIHVWTLCGAPALGLMFTIYKWLSPRRRDSVKRISTHLVINGQWRRFRNCEVCTKRYLPYKRVSRTCSQYCYNKLWIAEHRAC